MSRGPQTFRQRDVAAAIRAARAGGLEVTRVEIDRAGKIVLVTTKGALEAAPGNEWDTVLETQEKDED
jgi:hypothetical protein